MNGFPENRRLESVQIASLPIGTKKRCPQCKKIKELNTFSKDRTTKSGRCYYCKECRSLNRRNLRKANLEKERAKGRKRYAANPEIWKEGAKKWRAAHLNKVKRQQKEWREKNKERLKESQKRWNNMNKGKVDRRKREWAMDNKDKVKKAQLKFKERYPERRKETLKKLYLKNRKDPKFKLNQNISSHIRSSLKGNKSSQHWEDLVNYSLSDLKKHIEKQFIEGMTWENYGEWHIDHIIPISVFNFEKPEDIDFKRCWGLRNLRPLWAEDNLKKHAKLGASFQPSFIFP